MTCLMPVVPLSWEIEPEFNSNKTVAVSTETHGVASYIGPNGKDRADVYVGFVMDGYMGSRNISTSRPDIKMEFYLQPTLSCPAGVNFDPYNDEMITIKVGLSSSVFAHFFSLTPLSLSDTRNITRTNPMQELSSSLQAFKHT
jgi:hypothetical protein